MPIVLIWDYLRDDTSLHFTVSLINQTACIDLEHDYDYALFLHINCIIRRNKLKRHMT